MPVRTFETLLYAVEDGIATITLNRPEKLNAFTSTMMLELIDAFDATDADDAVRAVIVTGLGRAFCAGADLGAGGATFDYNARRAEATGESINGGNNAYFNLLAFTTPVAGQFGNAGVDTIPGPFQMSFNAALNRAFRFADSRRTLQFRLSATNALNHVYITSFGTTVNSTTYGLPTAAAATRTVQLLVRFSF